MKIRSDILFVPCGRTDRQTDFDVQVTVHRDKFL